MSDRIFDPPPDWVRLYEEALRTGLRLSLHPFIIEFFQFLNISLSLIVLNSFHFIYGFLVIYFLIEIRPTILFFNLSLPSRSILTPRTDGMSPPKRSRSSD